MNGCIGNQVDRHTFLICSLTCPESSSRSVNASVRTSVGEVPSSPWALDMMAFRVLLRYWVFWEKRAATNSCSQISTSTSAVGPRSLQRWSDVAQTQNVHIQCLPKNYGIKSDLTLDYLVFLKADNAKCLRGSEGGQELDWSSHACRLRERVQIRGVAALHSLEFMPCQRYKRSLLPLGSVCA